MCLSWKEVDDGGECWCSKCGGKGGYVVSGTCRWRTMGFRETKRNEAMLWPSGWEQRLVVRGQRCCTEMRSLFVSILRL